MTDSSLYVMGHIIWDNELIIALNTTYKDNYQMYLAYNTVIDPLFTTVRSLHKEINKITIYSDNTINPHGNILRPLSDIKDIEWLDITLNTTVPHLIVSSEKK